MAYCISSSFQGVGYIAQKQLASLSDSFSFSFLLLVRTFVPSLSLSDFPVSGKPQVMLSCSKMNGSVATFCFSELEAYSQSRGASTPSVSAGLDRALHGLSRCWFRLRIALETSTLPGTAVLTVCCGISAQNAGRIQNTPNYPLYCILPTTQLMPVSTSLRELPG